MKPIAKWTKRDWNIHTLQFYLAFVLFWFLHTYGAGMVDSFIAGFLGQPPQ